MTSPSNTLFINVPGEKATALNKLRERAKSRGTPVVRNLEKQQTHMIHDILYELMYSGELSKAVVSTKNNKLIEGIEFTKRAVLFGIEREAFERELISRLLSASYEFFNGNEIRDGFQLLLFRLPDITLDVPHAPIHLSKFIARAIHDEILPPVFLKDAYIDNSKAKECMSIAYGISHSTIERVRMEHIWGPGDLTSVTALKTSVENTLDEYFDNPDLKGTTQAIAELNVPSYIGQVIKFAIFKSLERNSELATKNFFILLEHWISINLIGDNHIKRGFQQAWLSIDDLKLDVPKAGNVLPEFQKTAINKKLLPEDFSPK